MLPRAPVHQAKTLRASLQAADAKEAGPLDDRIKLVESCQVLAFSKMNTIQKHELDAHLLLLQNHDVHLPFRIRRALLERQANDALIAYCDVISKDENIASQKLDFAIAKVAVWLECSSECVDMDLSATGVWTEAAEDIRLKQGQGHLNEAEALEALNQAGKDCLLFDYLYWLYWCTVFYIPLALRS